MASHELIVLQRLIYEKKIAVKQDIEIKTEKLKKLESEIIDYAKNYYLWKPRYKTFADLYSDMKEAKRCQRDDFGLLQMLYFHWKFGPKSRNDEIRPKVEKYDRLKEELEELKMRNELLEKEPPPIPAYFIQAGMALQEACYNKYILTADARDIIYWFFYNNHESDLTEIIFQKTFITKDRQELDISTIKRYFRDAKKLAAEEKRKPENIIE